MSNKLYIKKRVRGHTIKINPIVGVHETLSQEEFAPRFNMTRDLILDNILVTNQFKIPVFDDLPSNASPGEIILNLADRNFYGCTGLNWIQLTGSDGGGSQPLAVVLAAGNSGDNVGITNLNDLIVDTAIASTFYISNDLNMAGNITVVDTLYANVLSGAFTGSFNITSVQELTLGAKINGVLFTGASDITISGGRAEELFGTTLSSSVKSSSLVQLGILSNLTLNSNLNSGGKDVLNVGFLPANTFTIATGSVYLATTSTLSLTFGSITSLFAQSATISGGISSSTLVAGQISTTHFSATLANVVNLFSTSVSVNSITASFAAVSGTSTFTAITASTIYNISFLSATNASVSEGVTTSTLLATRWTTTTLQVDAVNGVNLYASTITIAGVLTCTVTTSTLATIGSLSVDTLTTNIASSSVVFGRWNGNPIPVVNGGTSRSTWTSNTVVWASGATILTETNALNDAVLVTTGSGTPFLSATLPLQTQSAITYIGTMAETLDLGGKNPINYNSIDADFYAGNFTNYERIVYPGSTLSGNIIQSLVQSASLGSGSWAARTGNTSLNLGARANASGDFVLSGFYLSNPATIYNSAGSLVATLPFTSGGTTYNGSLIKYDSAGNVSWATRYYYISLNNPAETYGTVINNIGDVVSTGYYGAGTEFVIYNPDRSTAFTLTSAITNQDAFIIKYDYNGRAQWATNITGSGNELALCAGLNDYSDLVVSGFYTSTPTVYNSDRSTAFTLPFNGGSDAFVVNYSKFGFANWGAYISNINSDVGWSIDVNNNRRIALTGFYSGTPIFYNSNRSTGASLSPLTGEDCFIATYNINGNVDWVTKIGGVANDRGTGIEIDESNYITVGGNFLSTLCNFYNVNGSIGTSLQGTGSKTGFVARYTPTGTVQWASKITGGTLDAYYLSANNSGNAVLVGSNTATVTVYNSNGSTSFTMPFQGAVDGFLATFDKNGNAKWGATIRGTSGPAGEFPRGVGINDKGEVYVAGNYQSQSNVFLYGRTPLLTIPYDGTTSTFIVKLVDESGSFDLIDPALDAQPKLITSDYPETILYERINGSTTTVVLYNGASMNLIWDDPNKTWINQNSVLNLDTGGLGRPSLTFLNDFGTGISAPTANNLSLSTNGNSRILIDSDGYVMKPFNCGFNYYRVTNTSTITGDGTDYFITGFTIHFDTNFSYNTATGVFSTPVSGFYLLQGCLNMSGITLGHTNGLITLVKNGVDYSSTRFNPINIASTAGGCAVDFNNTVYLLGNDQIKLKLNISGGPKTVILNGAANVDTLNFFSYFAGYLIG